MELKELSPKYRFSSLANNYAKYRPNYPNEIISFLTSAINLSKWHIIADIGSGTGISTKLFLENGNEVYGIEPNEEMRFSAEKHLCNFINFHSINAASEDTKLASESVDMIISGQAFHWFEPEATRKEFLRILKPNGYVVIFNNRRKPSNTRFMNEYSKLVEKYSEKGYTNSLNTDLPYFFQSRTIHEEVFPNSQVFNLEKLLGDLVTYSYMPHEGDASFNEMISEFELLFNKYNNNGTLTFDYETVLYYCKMKYLL